jgi:hypothetical protein
MMKNGKKRKESRKQSGLLVRNKRDNISKKYKAKGKKVKKVKIKIAKPSFIIKRAARYQHIVYPSILSPISRHVSLCASR